MGRAISPEQRHGSASGKITTMRLIGQSIVRKRKILIAKKSESSIEI